MRGVRKKVEGIIGDLPVEWSPESAHLESAFSSIQLAIESAENRRVGEAGAVLESAA